MASGVAFLHSKNIAHRDLKPANILVTNRHYSEISFVSGSAEQIGREFTLNPVVAKLADFGEGRSDAIQTLSIIQTRTTVTNIRNRGTIVFRAPEVSKETAGGSIKDLQSMDVWALGLTAWNAINPDCHFPYQVIELNLT